MTDPYREATRHERKGLSTIAKVFLIGGGLMVAAVIALVIWVSVAVDRMVEEFEDAWRAQGAEVAVSAEAMAEERAKAAREQAVAVSAAATSVQAAGRAAEVVAIQRSIEEIQQSIAEAQDPVAAEFGRAAATVMSGWLQELEVNVEPAEAEFGLRFATGSSPASWSLGFASVNELLDEVAQGGSVLAGTERAQRNRGGENVVLPDWVPVYPDARSANSFAARQGESSFGFTALVAEGSGHRVLDWYDRTAQRLARDGENIGFRVTRDDEDRRQDLRADLGRYAMEWDGRRVSVFVIEDDHGDSLILLLYRG